jgi:hypothetical protein
MRKTEREQFWRKVVGEQAHSGLSVGAFCRERRLNESTFDFWRRKVQPRAKPQTAAEPARDARSAEASPAQAERGATEPNKERPHGVAHKSTPVDRAKSNKHQPTAPVEEREQRPTDGAVPRTARDELHRLFESIEIPKQRPAARDAEADTAASDTAGKSKAASAVKEHAERSSDLGLRQEERYRLTDTKALGTRIEMVCSDKKTRIDAELIDISPGGVRLYSPSPVRKGQSLRIEIAPKDLEMSLSVWAKVCWTTLAPKGGHWLGCSVEPKIPHEMLNLLASHGLLERRHDTRRKVHVTLPGCWELSPKELDVSLVNVSAGGVCLSMPKGGKPGDRIRLTLPGDNNRPTYVILTACWQIKTDDGYMVGCTYGQRTTYGKLLQLADAQKPRR